MDIISAMESVCADLVCMGESENTPAREHAFASAGKLESAVTLLRALLDKNKVQIGF
jgi:hypothetical protein